MAATGQEAGDLVSLQPYRAKRRFQHTPEPRGTAGRGQGPLRFVVQKHHASRLHYDLRLEAGGSLKSWAVPKGPSLHPNDRRLAVQVEDHPLDYRLFEGIIPAGNYGAGTVMVWDEGTYHLPLVTNRKECDRLVQQGLEEGKLHFILHGKKLQGEFILVRPDRTKANAWLLFKKVASSVSGPPGSEDRSVLSGRTLPEIAAGTAPRDAGLVPGIDLADAPRAPAPRHVKPMLATPATAAFDHADWFFEVKWDGYRAIAEVGHDRVQLYSRKRLSLERQFAPVVEALAHLGHEAVLDGEVVVVDQAGKAQFQLLQQYAKSRRGTLLYYAFDLLWLDGHDLRSWPLWRRKEVLAGIIGDLPHVRLSEHIAEQGVAFFAAVSARGLEGMVAKDGRSLYREGVRGRSWLKIKTQLRQEAVIGGFTEPRGSRKGLGALVLGVWEGGDLVYVGHAGSGFTEEVLADLRPRLEALVEKTCPFKKRPRTNAPVHWVQPRLVCEVSFTEWTDDAHMRHPVFVGLRQDKAASDVRRERPQSVEALVDHPPAKPARTPARPPPAQAHRHGHASGPLTIDGHAVPLTNLGKVYWPEDGFTKGDLIEYYHTVSSILLPYLRDRPQSLHRHPNGIQGMSFFQKDVSRQPPPEWVQTVEVVSDTDGKRTRTLLCQDEATLVYLANLGCIELNPWNGRVGSLDVADYVLLDLDPVDISFERVIEAAQAIRKTLGRVGADSVCKTSGKRGLHVYIPFAGRHEQVKQFAELIARVVHAQLPDSTSLVRQPSGRQGRVYLDYLQNGRGKTLAAPYSVRPVAGATVSTPLKWNEVRRGLDPTRFTIQTMGRRLKQVGDLWQPVLGPGVDLRACLERLSSLVRRHGKR